MNDPRSNPRHTPEGTGIFLDHLAHWISDMKAGAGDLERMGFVLTPYTEHTHSPAPGAPVEPAGTANHCIMLQEGYLEILTATADTDVGREVRARIARHVGVHLAAFCVKDAAAERERLVAQGFAQRPLVGLERDAEMADGRTATLRFTVIRPEAGLLPEGRVQFLTQHTPELVWEDRWLHHPNGVEALTDIVFCVEDVDECARRYARYLRTDADPLPGGGRALRFERGALSIIPMQEARSIFRGIAPPPPPCMAGYALRARELDATRQFLEAAGLHCVDAGQGTFLVQMPESLGGVVAVHDGRGPPWRRD